MTFTERTKIVAKILKKRLNLQTEEAVHIGYVIIEALDRAEKVEVKPNES